MQTPMPLSSRVLAARCSRLFTSTRCLRLAQLMPTVRQPIFIRYGRPGSIGSSSIHTRVASNWSATAGGASARASMSPRLMSISSARVRVTAWPQRASCSSPAVPKMPLTTLCWPEGRARTRSPTRMLPAAMLPQ
ncbi:hypothetical protein D3C78_1229830 [compost metagenome]